MSLRQCCFDNISSYYRYLSIYKYYDTIGSTIFTNSSVYKHYFFRDANDFADFVDKKSTYTKLI